jgi:hypothetical protein
LVAGKRKDELVSDANLITDLQRIAADFDYDHDVPDPTEFTCALRKARPQASPEQLLIAIRRATTELEVRVTAVNGWYIDYDITDPRWQWLERMKCHIFDLGEAALNI